LGFSLPQAARSKAGEFTVTGDEIRDLMGRYATGALTDSERSALYEAALDDQELFDELAREHELKLILEEPGARQRLIAALPISDKSGGRWVWGAIGALAAAVLIIALLAQRKEPPKEIAQAIPPPAVPAIAPATIDRTTGVQTGVERRENPPPSQAPQLRDQAAPVPLEKTLTPEADAKAETGAKKDTAVKQEETKPAGLQDAQSNAAGAPPAPAAAAPPPPAQAFSARQTAGAIAPAAALRSAAARFGFSYVLNANTELVITAQSGGHLIIQPQDTSGNGAFVQALTEANLKAGERYTYRIPDAADSVRVTFEASANAPATTPQTRSDTSGTVENGNPSPNSSVTLMLRRARQ
jgi:cytoskeletal protein RodZ